MNNKIYFQDISKNNNIKLLRNYSLDSTNIKHAFEDLGMKKMWCDYFDGNTKSKRVQEKCGFKYIMTKENVPSQLVGELRTEHITCISKEEWNNA